MCLKALEERGQALLLVFSRVGGSLPWGLPGGQQCLGGVGTAGRSCFPQSAAALAPRCPTGGGLPAVRRDGLPVVLEGRQESECCGWGVAQRGAPAAPSPEWEAHFAPLLGGPS